MDDELRVILDAIPAPVFQADAAMYRVKAGGNNAIGLYA
jgi:hypothetical protein